jgi:hypothetical protein
MTRATEPQVQSEFGNGGVCLTSAGGGDGNLWDLKDSPQWGHLRLFFHILYSILNATNASAKIRLAKSAVSALRMKMK